MSRRREGRGSPVSLLAADSVTLVHHGLTGVSSKGNGRDHAKFSPVATASYRLLPRIRFTEVRREGGLHTQRRSVCNWRGRRGAGCPV